MPVKIQIGKQNKIMLIEQKCKPKCNGDNDAFVKHC
jgi:hypothetical protein